jgi:hypothetical protein
MQFFSYHSRYIQIYVGAILPSYNVYTSFLYTTKIVQGYFRMRNKSLRKLGNLIQQHVMVE